MQSYWTSHAPGGAVTVVDIDSAGDPYSDLRTAFQAAKDAVRTAAVLGGASDGGDKAVQDAYHAGLVPPFWPERHQTLLRRAVADGSRGANRVLAHESRLGRITRYHRAPAPPGVYLRESRHSWMRAFRSCIA